MSDVMGSILYWLIYVVLLPLTLGTLAALPAWLKRHPILGNLIGSGVIAAVIFVLIWQQYGAFVQAQAACAGSSAGCAASAEALYMPYLIMVVLGWVDVFILLFLSGMVEDRLKSRWLDRSRL
jgi:NADH:ubiquinone oxidoreductase subunit 6 (subunit J)